jgi:uncharacterized phage infection (PIP) family protein YhgE
MEGQMQHFEGNPSLRPETGKVGEKGKTAKDFLAEIKADRNNLLNRLTEAKITDLETEAKQIDRHLEELQSAPENTDELLSLIKIYDDLRLELRQKIEDIKDNDTGVNEVHNERLKQIVQELNTQIANIEGTPGPN